MYNNNFTKTIITSAAATSLLRLKLCPERERERKKKFRRRSNTTVTGINNNNGYDDKECVYPCFIHQHNQYILYKMIIIDGH